MNKYQRLVLVAAMMNALVMLLFPPFSSQSLAKGVLPSFEGFYPLFTQLGHKTVYKELLVLQILFLVINTLSAWLVLQSKKHHGDIPSFSFMQAIGWFSAINLAIIFVFPPFEPYHSLLRNDTGGFDSFYFVFGSRSHRAIYWPLLYLECMFIIINALGHILLFSAVKRSDDEIRRKLMQLTDDLPDSEVEKLTEDIRHQIATHPTRSPSSIGRGQDRRHAAKPPPGPERRTGSERRD